MVRSGLGGVPVDVDQSRGRALRRFDCDLDGDLVAAARIAFVRRERDPGPHAVWDRAALPALAPYSPPTAAPLGS